MSLPIAKPAPSDPVLDLGEELDRHFLAVTKLVQSELLFAVGKIAEVGTAAFWAAQGTNGRSLLTTWSNFITLLQNVEPDLLVQQIVSAVSNLQIQTNGTVIVVP